MCMVKLNKYFKHNLRNKYIPMKSYLRIRGVEKFIS